MTNGSIFILPTTLYSFYTFTSFQLKTTSTEEVLSSVTPSFSLSLSELHIFQFAYSDCGLNTWTAVMFDMRTFMSVATHWVCHNKLFDQVNETSDSDDIETDSTWARPTNEKKHKTPATTVRPICTFVCCCNCFSVDEMYDQEQRSH